MVRGKLWAIVRREFLERVVTKWFVIATIFGPLVFGALLFLPSYFASRQQPSADMARVLILDATGTSLGHRVAAELMGGVSGDTGLARVREIPPDSIESAAQRARRQVEGRAFRGYLILDDATLAGRSARYVGTNVTSFTDMARIERVIRQEVLGERLERAGIAAVDADQLKSLRLEMRAERLARGGAGGSGQMNVLFAISIALLLYVTIFLYGQSVLRGVMEEKQSRVAEIVISSVSATKLLAGKVIGVAGVGLTQLLIWSALGFLMLRFRETVLARFGVATQPLLLPAITPEALILLLLYFVLGYLFYAALFAVIGAIVSSEQEAQQAQLPVAMFLVVTIAFVQPVLASPDSGLAIALTIIPFSAPIITPLRMSVTIVPTWQIVVSLLELALGCYVVVGISARIYRIGLLMYGKQPRLREIIRWARVS